jgi:hypothetical protein
LTGRFSKHKGSVVGFSRTLFAYLVLPNLLFAAAGVQFEILPRALLNLDYLAVAAITPFVNVPCAVALMSIALLADLFRCCGSIYYFSQRDAFSALIFIRDLPLARVAGITCLLLVAIVACSWILIRIGGGGIEVRHRTLWVGLLTLTLGVVGVWGGNSSLRFRDDAAMSNLSTSAGVSLLKTIWTGVLRRRDPVAPVAVDSATQRAGWLNGTPTAQNVVLVIVESGGEPLDPKWQPLLGATFEDEAIRSRYNVARGTVPFSGATVPGEFREFCAIASSATEPPPHEALIKCLPNRLRAEGFATLYLHGFSSAIFRRNEWLPQLGFERELFHAQFRDLKDCGGPFRGTCDEDIAKWIGDYLANDRQRRHFIAFMTLNSHLPVAADPDSGAILGCGTKNAQIADEAVCNLMGLVMRAERAIVKVALRPDLPDTEFLIVGDHAPPFMQRERRDMFSKKVVPFVHLTPRSVTNSPKAQ